MCGIIGAVALAGPMPGGIEAGMAHLAHRGPDGHGLLRRERCLLGHRRLSIVDLDGGRQPLVNEAGDLFAIHNGEIYNHRDVIASLPGRHRPLTASDGEALLHTVEDLGADGLSRLRGMFAAALWDGHRLTLARDQLGIKPLYWSRTTSAVCFASEIGALLALVPAESIREFPPGHVWDGRGEPRALWAPLGEALPSAVSDELETAADRLLVLLRGAVGARLMGDVPIGAFLSGGLDSSLITALLVESRPGAPTFAVGLRGSADLERAREVAGLLATDHHEIILDEDQVLASIASVVYALESWDVDLVRSAIPCWFVSRLARATVKVVLTGEGADELFAGYAYHGTYSDPDALHRELVRSVRELHRINLQRVDRMTMDHGVEGRVPFLDTEVVSYALSLPIALKRDELADKLVLRRAAQRLLPPTIALRPKQQFDQGSGIAELLERRFGDRAAEERHYREALQHVLPAGADHLVAHWQDGRLAMAR
jgi:asparagine synthase (glutamine-hydrolysing)